jgi:hypothetical protein
MSESGELPLDLNKMQNMELSQYEALLATMTCRAIGFLPQMISEQQLKEKLPTMSRTYPFLNWRISSNVLQNDSTPTITLAEVEEQPKLDFLSKCFSTFQSNEFCEIFLISMTGTPHGAVLISCCHSVCDAPLMCHFLCDLLSSNSSDFPILSRPSFSELLNGVPDARQENLVANPVQIPDNPNPPPGPVFFKGICQTFSIAKILKIIKPLKIRPQVFFTAAEIYTIVNIFKLSPDFDMTSQVNINTRRFFDLHPKTPFLASTLIYLYSHITRQLVIKDLLISLQKQIDDWIPRYVKPHFKNFANGNYGLQKATTLISNMGVFECDNHDIWGAGGMYNVPEVIRPRRTFTSHICTIGDQANVTFTFLSPGCDEQFIQAFIQKMMWFFENPEVVIDLPVVD